MTKTEIDYIKDRVGQVTSCILGHANSLVNNAELAEDLSLDEMVDQIIDGRAKLLEEDLRDEGIYFTGGHAAKTNLKKMYDFDYSEIEAKAKAHNKRLQDKLEEFEQEIHLEGKRIVDMVVLGLVDKTKLPKLLEAFSARQNDFVL